MLPIESFYIYFYVLLGGFMTVWAFRKYRKSSEKISEFEYIGFSSFWGIFLIVVWQTYTNFAKPPANLFENPLSTGFILSLAGMIGAVSVSELCDIYMSFRKLGRKGLYYKFKNLVRK